MPQPSMYTTAPPTPGGPAPFHWHAGPGALMPRSDSAYGPLSGYGQGGGAMAGGAGIALIGQPVGLGMTLYGLYKRSWAWGLGGVAVTLGSMIVGGGIAFMGAGQKMAAGREEFDADAAAARAAFEARVAGDMDHLVARRY